MEQLSAEGGVKIDERALDRAVEAWLLETGYQIASKDTRRALRCAILAATDVEPQQIYERHEPGRRDGMSRYNTVCTRKSNRRNRNRRSSDESP